jgi:hypothetical protein
VVRFSKKSSQPKCAQMLQSSGIGKSTSQRRWDVIFAFGGAIGHNS